MSEEIKVPILGESISEATVAKWLKNEGDEVSTDEPLVELETDKVNIEVTSPSTGQLSKISVKSGQTVEVGSVLGVVNGQVSKSQKVNLDLKQEVSNISKNEEPDQKVSNISKNEESDPDITSVKSSEDFKVLDEEIKKTTIVKRDKAEKNNSLKNDEVLVLTEEVIQKKIANTNETLSPAVKKIITENKINILEVEGTGKNGRITKTDLINLMGNKPKKLARKEMYGEEERIKMSRLRLTIAKRLKEAQDTAAMLTTFNEVDMSNVKQMRSDYKEDFVEKYSVKLGFMSFFVKACIVGLKNFPIINAEIDKEEIIYKNYYNISIAVGTDKGLVVPVLKKADEMSFAEIEKNISRLGEKAKNGKITIEDLQGGTFTITNGGIYGSMLSTPIINPPQSAVLGMHNISERAVVKNGELVSRPIMYIALSYDHRIIDGKEAVSFLKCIKECLEEPRRLFLDL